MNVLLHYLGGRKQRKARELMVAHAGRCRAVGVAFARVADAWFSKNKEEMDTAVALIHTEEKSADNLELDVIRELSRGSLPREIREQLIQVTSKLDLSAGGAKRASKNMSSLIEHPLPEPHSSAVASACKILDKIFKSMEHALKNLSDSEIVLTTVKKVNALEHEVDEVYAELKRGYFDIEKTFKSAAALLILDHVARDIEIAADRAKEAAQVLFMLCHTRK